MLYVVASVAVCVRSSGERTNEYPAMGGITVHNVGSMTFVAKGLITYTHTHHVLLLLCVQQQHIHIHQQHHILNFKMDDFRVDKRSTNLYLYTWKQFFFSSSHIGMYINDIMRVISLYALSPYREYFTLISPCCPFTLFTYLYTEVNCKHKLAPRF